MCTVFDILLISKTLIILTIAIISPGPDFFMVLRNSLMYGRKAGFFSALGISIGCIITFTILICGLKFLFEYKIIKVMLGIICGLYLIYLGFSSIRSHSRHKKIQVNHKQSKPMFTYFKNGLLTNLLNPKLYTISGAILTFAEQQKPSLMTNGAIVIGNALIAFTWFSLTCILMSHPKTQNLYLKRETAINRTLGCVLILVGIRVIWYVLFS